jgi:hypothetical protein
MRRIRERQYGSCGLLRPEFILCAVDQASYVLVVLDDDEQGHGHLCGDEERRPAAADKEPRKDRKAGRAQHGAQGYVAAQSQHNEKQADCGERRPWRGDEEDAETRGHALAAFELEPHGKHVADDGTQRSQRLGVARRHAGGERCPNERADPHRGAALQHVKSKCRHAKAFGAGADHICGADVAAAHGADVLVTKDANQDVSEGNRSEQIRNGRNGNNGERHNG